MSDGEVTAAMDTVNAEAKTAAFQLPQGWTIKKVPRSDGTREDKYYFEPGTGKKFDSMRAVMRHLTEAPKESSRFGIYYQRQVRRKVTPLIADKKYFAGSERKSSRKSLKKDSASRLMKLDEGKLAVTSHTKAADSSYNLPEGWMVKEVPRRNTTKGSSYKIFFEPGTGRQFLSLVSVKRYLAESKDGEPFAGISKTGTAAKKLDSKNKTSREKATSPTCGSTKPPASIKWVITGGDGENSTFRPFIGDSMVQEHTIQLWAERFMVSINGKNCTASNI